MKTTAFFAVALHVCCTAFAQETGYQPGAIITSDNERLEGLIKHVNMVPARILQNIKFKTAEGEKVTTYSPHELFAYEIEGDVFVSKKTLDGRTIFVKKFNTGKLKLYGELAFDGSASYNVTYVPYIQLDTDRVIRHVPQISFRNQMLDYLKDAPRLCQLISDRTLKWKDIEEIVFLYNEEIESGEEAR